MHVHEGVDEVYALHDGLSGVDDTLRHPKFDCGKKKFKK